MVSQDRWCLLTTPSLALSQEEALQMQSCGLAAAGEIPSSEQEALYGLCGLRESICLTMSLGRLSGGS